MTNLKGPEDRLTKGLLKEITYRDALHLKIGYPCVEPSGYNYGCYLLLSFLRY